MHVSAFVGVYCGGVEISCVFIGVYVCMYLPPDHVNHTCVPSTE